VSLERGPLSLVSTTEELLGRKSSDSGLEIREYGRRDPPRWPRGTLYPKKFALTSSTCDGRSAAIVRLLTQATEFRLLLYDLRLSKRAVRWNSGDYMTSYPRRQNSQYVLWLISCSTIKCIYELMLDFFCWFGFCVVPGMSPAANLSSDIRIRDSRHSCLTRLNSSILKMFPRNVGEFNWTTPRHIVGTSCHCDRCKNLSCDIRITGAGAWAAPYHLEGQRANQPWLF
jgi:hypothetical protein